MCCLPTCRRMDECRSGNVHLNQRRRTRRRKEPTRESQQAQLSMRCRATLRVVGNLARRISWPWNLRHGTHYFGCSSLTGTPNCVPSLPWRKSRVVHGASVRRALNVQLDTRRSENTVYDLSACIASWLYAQSGQASKVSTGVQSWSLPVYRLTEASLTDPFFFPNSCPAARVTDEDDGRL